MRSTKKFAIAWKLLPCALVLLGWLSLPTLLRGQATGYNVVWSSASGFVSSPAFIDASVYSGDICARITAALNSIPSSVNGAVIDARGIGAGTTQNCSTNPWASTSNYSVVLLPSGTIVMSTEWVLLPRTRIIGEGSGGSGTSTTTLQASSSFTGGTDGILAMIEMGSSSPSGCGICVGVAVEDLTLDGNNVSGLTGIFNAHSQELSDVKRVNLYRIVGTGLYIKDAQAQNGGPYSDIRFDTGGASNVSGSTRCVKIVDTETNSSLDIRGIHGLTCISNGTPSAAVQIDGSRNSIRDVQMNGFVDGILLGSNNTASGNILSNITGGSNVTNLVHIKSTHPVTHLSILGLTNGGTNAIEDDVSLPSPHTISDATVGIYALGESFAGGYSRFTTSPTLPNWGVGSRGNIASQSCTSPGAFFSDTSGTSAHTLYACVGTTWKAII